MATLPVMLPVRGTLGALDTQNPNLLPLMDVPVSSGQGTMDVMSPAKFLATYPRVDATGNVTVGGTITNLDTVKLTFTSGIFPGGSYTTAAYTVVTADTTTTIAEQLQALVANDPVLSAAGIVAELAGTSLPAQVNFFAPGPVGNTIVVSAVKTGTTETYTFAAGGALAGGSGPIIPTAAFAFSYNGVTINFLYGQPRNVGSDMVAAMVAQARPII